MGRTDFAQKNIWLGPDARTNGSCSIADYQIEFGHLWSRWSQFVLQPPLAEADVLNFEHQHGVHLPADYRDFLTQIGNGGAGLYYGIFPLGGDGQQLRVPGLAGADGFICTLSKPFPLDHEWNDLRGMLSDDLLEKNEAEYEKLFDEFDKTYGNTSLVNGHLPICHRVVLCGSGLVVTGKEAGHIWHMSGTIKATTGCKLLFVRCQYTWGSSPRNKN